MRIESSVTTERAGKRLTILRGEPSTLPDIPRPLPPVPPTPEQIAAWKVLAASQPKVVQLHFGATVYDHRVSVVHWRHPDRPEVGYEAVVGLDFGVFAGMGDFTHKEVKHSLMLLHSNLPLALLSHPNFRVAPALPQVPAKGYVVTKGDPTDADGMHPLTALMDLYAAEEGQLLAAHAARLEHSRAAAAWRKANPVPEPTQRTFWLRPHRGSRYLKEKRGAQ
jgi:hypothetical protein